MESEITYDIPIIIKQYSVAICSTVANIKQGIDQVDYTNLPVSNVGNEYSITQAKH